MIRRGALHNEGRRPQVEVRRLTGLGGGHRQPVWRAGPSPPPDPSPLSLSAPRRPYQLQADACSPGPGYTAARVGLSAHNNVLRDRISTSLGIGQASCLKAGKQSPRFGADLFWLGILVRFDYSLQVSAKYALFMINPADDL